MNEEVVFNILQQFSAIKDIGTGTEMGLAVCYGIIQEHGGVIDVASIERSSSGFVI
jgi:signal transduction histidine kinase